MPKIGSNLGLMALHNRKDQIFDFLIFSQNMAFLGPKNAKIRFFHYKKGHILAKNQKNQKFGPWNC